MLKQRPLEKTLTLYERGYADGREAARRARAMIDALRAYRKPPGRKSTNDYPAIAAKFDQGKAAFEEKQGRTYTDKDYLRELLLAAISTSEAVTRSAAELLLDTNYGKGVEWARGGESYLRHVRRGRAATKKRI